MTPLGPSVGGKIWMSGQTRLKKPTPGVRGKAGDGGMSDDRAAG